MQHDHGDNSPSTRPPGRVPVRLYAERYLQRREGELAAKSLLNARQAVAELLGFLGARAESPMAEMTAADAEAFVKAALWKVSRPTVGKYVGYLAPMFAAALAEGVVDANPFGALRVPAARAASTPKPKDFTLAEIRAMLGVLEPEWRSMVLCSVCLGGLRLGGAATLRWAQVDAAAGVVRLATGRNGREWPVPLVPVLERHLEALPREGEYIHPTAAARYLKFGSAPLSIQFLRRLAKAGIIEHSKAPQGMGRRKLPKTFHSLHTAVSAYLAHAGVKATPATAPAALRQALADLSETLV